MRSRIKPAAGCLAHGPNQPSPGTFSWLLRPMPHSLPLLKKIVFLLLQDQNMTFTASQRGFHALVGHFPYRCPQVHSLVFWPGGFSSHLGKRFPHFPPPPNWPCFGPSLTPKQHPNLLSVSMHQLELSRRGGGRIGNPVPQAE